MLNTSIQVVEVAHVPISHLAKRALYQVHILIGLEKQRSRNIQSLPQVVWVLITQDAGTL